MHNALTCTIYHAECYCVMVCCGRLPCMHYIYQQINGRARPVILVCNFIVNGYVLGTVV